MCYDISFTTTVEVITDYLPELEIAGQLDIDFETTMHVQAQAFRNYPVIIFEDGKYKLVKMEWGIIADYMDTPEKIKKLRPLMCNARSEKILDDKRSFWRRIRKRRCLIPVTGIFEHREIKGWKKKVPYFIKIRGRNLFCLPGLYYYNPQLPSDVETGEVKGMYTLITRSGNSLMQKIHNAGDNAFRMPLFLADKQMELKWLDPNLTDEQLQEILDYQLPSEMLEYWAVDTIRTTKPRADNKTKVDPYEWPGLPELL